MKQYLNPKEAEMIFMKALAEWEATGSNEAWRVMWERVEKCCRYLAIYKCPGFPMVDDRAMDAAIHVMELLKRGYKPNSGSLSKFCSYPVTAALYGPRAVREDSESSFDENFADEAETNLVEYRGKYFDMEELMNMSKRTGVSLATILKDFKKLADETDLGYVEIIELLDEHYSKQKSENIQDTLTN